MRLFVVVEDPAQLLSVNAYQLPARIQYDFAEHIRHLLKIASQNHEVTNQMIVSDLM